MQYYIARMERPVKIKLTGSSGTIAYLSVGDTQVFPAQEITWEKNVKILQSTYF